MELEINRGTKLQDNKPESITILLIGDNGNTKGVVRITAKFDNSDIFRVEVRGGDVSINPPINFEADI